jgi:beta-phosphoglucomutase-like phosphatase (HAD superfamily)
MESSKTLDKLLILDLDGTIVKFHCDWDKINYLRRNGLDSGADAMEIEGAEYSTPVTYIIALIKEFKGTKAVFSSNSRIAVITALKKHNIFDEFSYIVSREDVREPKPAPEGLLKIMDTLKFSKDKVLYLGNRDVDESAGKAAGIKTIIL